MKRLFRWLFGRLEAPPEKATRYIHCEAGFWAEWNVALTDAEVAAITSGVMPHLIRPENLVYYAPQYFPRSE